jgi:hypothetical protein
MFPMTLQTSPKRPGTPRKHRKRLIYLSWVCERRASSLGTSSLALSIVSWALWSDRVTKPKKRSKAPVNKSPVKASVQKPKKDTSDVFHGFVNGGLLRWGLLHWRFRSFLGHCDLLALITGKRSYQFRRLTRVTGSQSPRNDRKRQSISHQ